MCLRISPSRGRHSVSEGRGQMSHVESHTCSPGDTLEQSICWALPHAPDIGVCSPTPGHYVGTTCQVRWVSVLWERGDW